MTWPAPTRADHQRFCVSEGWREVRDARGSTGTHHIVYELDLPDGRVLRTRISHPPGRVNYGASVWRHILRDQLGVSEAEFWACVKDGVKPQRGVIEPPKEAVPLEVVSMLINRVGLPETEVAQLSRADAIARLNQYWAESPVRPRTGRRPRRPSFVKDNERTTSGRAANRDDNSIRSG